MVKPFREFSADVGQKSMGVAGPDYIERDFDKLFAMLDPNKSLPTGEQGGIGSENMKPGAADDTVIGDREIDDTQESTGNVGRISDLLNWFANMIKSITGKSSWRVKPACTLEQVANSTIDGVKNIGGDIDFVAGTGMEIIPDSQNKKITFAAKNESIIPGPHAETHRSGGSDPITITSAEMEAVKKHSLIYLGESDNYNGIIEAIAVDENFVYVGGHSTRKVYKLNKIDLSKVAESIDYGGSILAIAVDD